MKLNGTDFQIKVWKALEKIKKDDEFNLLSKKTSIKVKALSVLKL